MSTILHEMERITGTREFPGNADNPVIMSWLIEIATAYPEYANYCKTYTHDSIAWCGLTMAICCVRCGIKPVKEFLWADNWRSEGHYPDGADELDTPRQGCVVTFRRTGGNHVAVYLRTEGDRYVVRGGNQADSEHGVSSDAVGMGRQLISNCTGHVWPHGQDEDVEVGKDKEEIDDRPKFSSLIGGFYSGDPSDRALPVSIRYNNPGALNVASWIQAQPGYLGENLTSMSGASKNKTVIFSAPEYGVAAWWKLMEKYRAAGKTTMGEIIDRYGGGQDYSAYIDKVAQWSDLGEDDEVPLDGSDDTTLINFAKAMFHYEAGRPTPLSDSQIKYGFDLARGKTVAPPTTPVVVPVAVKPPPASGGTHAGIVGVGLAILTGVGTFLQEYFVWIALALAIVAGALILYHYVKGRWPWTSKTSTGAVLPEQLPPSPPKSEDYLDQLSAHLAALRALSPAMPSPPPSTPQPPPQLSAGP